MFSKSLSSSTQSCVRGLALTRVPQGHCLLLAVRWVLTLLVPPWLCLKGGAWHDPSAMRPDATGTGCTIIDPLYEQAQHPQGFWDRGEESFSLGGWEIPVSVGLWCRHYWKQEFKFYHESESPRSSCFLSFAQGRLKLGLGFENRNVQISPLLPSLESLLTYRKHAVARVVLDMAQVTFLAEGWTVVMKFMILYRGREAPWFLEAESQWWKCSISLTQAQSPSNTQSSRFGFISSFYSTASLMQGSREWWIALYSWTIQ